MESKRTQAHLAIHSVIYKASFSRTILEKIIMHDYVSPTFAEVALDELNEAITILQKTLPTDIHTV